MLFRSGLTPLLQRVREEVSECGRRLPTHADREVESLEPEGRVPRALDLPLPSVVALTPGWIAQGFVGFLDFFELYAS